MTAGLSGATKSSEAPFGAEQLMLIWTGRAIDTAAALPAAA